MAADKSVSETILLTAPGWGPVAPDTSSIVENLGIVNNCFIELPQLIEIIQPDRVLGSGVGCISGVSIDTRKPMGEDHIFWAIKGQHFNGNDFVQEALKSGVMAAVVSRDDLTERDVPPGKTIIQAQDTLGALQNLAAVYRARFSCPVIGVTGSNGKTLVKEMLASILCRERRTYRSPLSYNTQVGAALSLLGIRSEHEAAIVEAGISLPGEMDRLERMIRPDHGILTAISKAHIGGLGSLENAFDEKLRLFNNLGPNSFLVVNGDDPICASARSLPCKVVTFGLSEGVDVRATHLEPLPDRGYRFNMRLWRDDLDVALAVPGEFNVLNALAAAAAAHLLGASPDAIRKGLQDFLPSPMRLEMHTTVAGVTLINDTYNSDPASIRGALDVLSKVGKGRRKIAILSDMLDLGLHSRQEHLSVGKEVVRAGVDQLITVGEHAALIGQSAALEGMDSRRISNTRSYHEAAVELEKRMNSGDVVLFKGSRWFRLERIARELVGSIGPTRLLVNLDSIARNIKTIRGVVGDDVGVMAVVKSFGYGNDSIRTSRVALENGVSYLAVAFADEGAALRQSRIDAPILVFNILPEEVDKIVRYRLSAVVPSLEIAGELNRAGARGRKIPVHIKIDTGMGRSGVWVDDAVAFIHRVLSMDCVEVEGIMTHFASADDPEDDSYTRAQIQAFRWLIEDLGKMGHTFRYIHAANTAASIRFPEARFNMVRPGLAIYGMYPSETVRRLMRLEQVITFCTKISQVKEHPPGRCISYNRRYRTCRPCRIATLPVGYNDGYPRFQSNRGEVLVKGRRVPVVGAVCMDNTMIDVTEVPEARVGDEAVLIGRQGDEEILPDEIAANGNTINYEIACKISPRVTRIFLQS